MTVTLNLPPEVEQKIKERASMNKQTLEEYLQRLVLLDAEKSVQTNSGTVISYPSEFSSPQERSKAIREWAESHPRVNHFVDDSRESIYAGRGE